MYTNLVLSAGTLSTSCLGSLSINSLWFTGGLQGFLVASWRSLTKLGG